MKPIMKILVVAAITLSAGLALAAPSAPSPANADQPSLFAQAADVLSQLWVAALDLVSPAPEYDDVIRERPKANGAASANRAADEGIGSTDAPGRGRSPVVSPVTEGIGSTD